jgi:ribosomal protein S2
VSEIINFRQARKRLDRVAQEEVAAANRAKHGLTKAERALKQSEAEKLRKSLDGAKREEPTPKETPQ